jgi:thioesterase domain-containing protein
MTAALRIEELLHSKIPITRAMGVRVAEYNRDRLVLTAPLAANVNHLGTAFGGSLNALAVLSGYALLWLELEDGDAHIVIRSSSISYDRPVTSELRAVCVRPDGEVLAKFKKMFYERGRARIMLSATIEEQGTAAVRFQGVFVAMRNSIP